MVVSLIDVICEFIVNIEFVDKLFEFAMVPVIFKYEELDKLPKFAYVPLILKYE